jgi:TM2 domain-containing membrane protein YozV
MQWGLKQKKEEVMAQSKANWLTLLLLSIFLGELGVDRFYVGKIGTGILKLLTLGAGGIWWLIDIILIVTGKFTDKDGYVISNKT